MIATNRTTCGIFLGVAGGFFASFKAFATALLSRNGEGMEIFFPSILILAAVGFVASAAVVNRRSRSFLAICVGYAPLSAVFMTGNHKWLLLHLIHLAAAAAGVTLGALVCQLLSSNANAPRA